MDYYSLGHEVHSKKTFSKIATAIDEKTANMLVHVLNAAQQSVQADVCHSCGTTFAPSAQYCHVCGTRR
jgi:uncharacterized OB-fold protein